MTVLPTRKPNRLPFEQIYKSNNGFFITICTHGKQCIFTDASVGECLWLPETTQPQTTNHKTKNIPTKQQFTNQPTW